MIGHPAITTLALAGACLSAPAFAQDAAKTGGKLLLTGGVSQVEGAAGGVSQVEGAAGGGLTPWALIGGQATSGRFGGSAFITRVDVGDYHLDTVGALFAFNDRVELSVARQRFDTEQVGALLGLGEGFTLQQDVIGLKVRVAGEAVLDSDRAMPQLAIGVQHKRNDQGAVLAFIGAKDDSGTDVYLSATKLFLAQGLLLNGTVRYTRANQIGILGFGGDRHDGYRPQLELSAAYLLSPTLAIGAEYRTKPDNLSIAGEDDWKDVFVAWAPNRHVSLTVAYVDLGNIVIRDHQRGVYASLQVGF